MKSKAALKDKAQSQKNLLPSHSSSSDSSEDEAMEDYEEEEVNGPIEEEKLSVNAESDSEPQKASKPKNKSIPTKNPTKKLRNQKKPRIVMNVSGNTKICLLTFF